MEMRNSYVGVQKGSKSSPKNYRPISLLCMHVEMCVESIINRSLTNHLKKISILSRRQFGFRTELSMSDLLVALQHVWHRAISQGGLVSVLAVDVARAFDKVSHRGLLHKAEQYGVTGPLLQWLRSYLSHPQIKVTVAEQDSATLDIASGVPQGSILGPTLFLIYANDAEDHLLAGAKLAVYADDITMSKCISTGENIPDETAILQQAVDALATWGNQWHITFDPEKSQTMTISHHRSRYHAPPINFPGTAVPEVEQLKLLG